MKTWTTRLVHAVAFNGKVRVGLLMSSEALQDELGKTVPKYKSETDLYVSPRSESLALVQCHHFQDAESLKHVPMHYSFLNHLPPDPVEILFTGMCIGWIVSL